MSAKAQLQELCCGSMAATFGVTAFQTKTSPKDDSGHYHVVAKTKVYGSQVYTVATQSTVKKGEQEACSELLSLVLSQIRFWATGVSWYGLEKVRSPIYELNRIREAIRYRPVPRDTLERLFEKCGVPNLLADDVIVPFSTARPSTAETEQIPPLSPTAADHSDIEDRGIMDAADEQRDGYFSSGSDEGSLPGLSIDGYDSDNSSSVGSSLEDGMDWLTEIWEGMFASVSVEY